MKPISRSEYVEVVVTDATLVEIPFPKQLTTLEKSRITSIEAFKFSTSPVAPSGKTMINDTVFKKSFVTFRIDNRDDVNKYPLTSLDVTTNDGKLKYFDNLKIDFSQSKIVVGSAAGLIVGEVYGFNFTYEKDKTC